MISWFGMLHTRVRAAMQTCVNYNQDLRVTVLILGDDSVVGLHQRAQVGHRPQK
jgi:hypothetical protein